MRLMAFREACFSKMKVEKKNRLLCKLGALEHCSDDFKRTCRKSFFREEKGVKKKVRNTCFHMASATRQYFNFTSWCTS
jgi:hypothetical protein